MRNWILITAGLTLGTATGWPQYKVDRKFLYPDAFKAGKPYSPGVLAGKTLYIAGQVDKDPKTGAQPKGIAEQTRMAMANMGHVLRAAGMDYGNVVSCHVQLADMGQYKEMNEVYGSYFGPDHFPARPRSSSPGCLGGANVEVSCIAYANKSKIASWSRPRDRFRLPWVPTGPVSGRVTPSTSRAAAAASRIATSSIRQSKARPNRRWIISVRSSPPPG